MMLSDRWTPEYYKTIHAGKTDFQFFGMMVTIMRLFFALPVDIENKLAIEHWRNRVFPPDIRPVPIDNFHITLNFLGEVKASSLDRLCEGATELLARLSLKRFRIEIDQCAYWSGSGILWIGPEQWPDELDQLQRKLASLAHTLGVAQSKRPYQPHITLFRSKAALPKPLLEPSFTLEADEVVLFESIQKKQGVQYECIEHWTLSGQTDIDKRFGAQSLKRRRRPSV